MNKRDNIPADLVARDQWVVWRLEDGAKKMPYSARGGAAKSNDPDTWSTFSAATAKFVSSQSNGKPYTGVGFVFAATDDFCGIDLDGCRNVETGKIAEWAREIIGQCNTYSEVSPSGTGVKLFCRGKWPLPNGKQFSPPDAPLVSVKTPKIEVYDWGRYYAVTGNILPGSPNECVDCQSTIDDIATRFAEPAPVATSTNPHTNYSGRPDNRVERCRKYVDKMPAAIAEQGGHNATFTVACEIFRFGLDDSDAWNQLCEFNQRCSPPWDERDLRHKLDSARERVAGEGEFGSRLRDDRGSRPVGVGASNVDHRAGKPEIKCGPDELRMTDAASAALAKRGDLFQRGGMLVQVRESPAPPPCIVRPEGGVRAVRTPRPRLRELIANTVQFLRLKKTGDGAEWLPCQVPQTLVDQIEVRGEWPEMPQLEGVVTSPQFLADGSILSTSGYHAGSGLYFAADIEFPPIPDRPTIDDAKRACASLLEVIADFPVDDVGRAAWLAIVLTVAARHAIDGPTPLFSLDANVRGSGKSKAADAIGMIHSGRELPRSTANGDDSEQRKMITATLLAGEPLVLLDNVAGVLGCPALDALLTSSTWTDRVLGVSQMTAAIPAKAVWIATGNNLQFGADTARRTLRIRLESPLENPEERTGFTHPDLLAWVKQQRGGLAAAAATILRAWHCAGRPDMGLPPWGSFESWSKLVRNPIVWLGLPDPGSTRQEVQRESDREAMLLRQLLDAWEQADPERHGLYMVDVLALAEKGEEPALTNVVAELTGPSGKASSRGIGMRLHHLRGRVCGGRYFDSRNTNRGALWVVRGSEEVGNRYSSDTRDTSDTNSNPTRARFENSSTPPVISNTQEHNTLGGRAENSVTSVSSVTPLACNHLDPSTWIERDGGLFCPGCGAWKGRALA